VSHPAILERPEGSFLPRPECRVGAPLGGFSLGAFRACWLLSFEYLYARTLGWSALTLPSIKCTVMPSRLVVDRWPDVVPGPFLDTRPGEVIFARQCATNNALGISAYKSLGVHSATYGYPCLELSVTTRGTRVPARSFGCASKSAQIRR